MKRAVLLCVVLSLFVFATPVLAQKPTVENLGNWKLAQDRDDFTDAVTSFLFIQDSIGFTTLAVSKEKGKAFVMIHTGVENKTKAMAPVEYRVDDGPIHEEEWILVNGSLANPDAASFLALVAAGSQLRFRIKSDTKTGPTLTYNVTGLAGALPKIGLR